MEIEKIKEKILDNLNELGIIARSIMLFGSRARGDYSKYSDYDFLIITEKTYNFKEKMDIAKKINQSLAQLLIPSDIIIKSAEELEHSKNRIGTVTREALKEGIVI